MTKKKLPKKKVIGSAKAGMRDVYLKKAQGPVHTHLDSPDLTPEQRALGSTWLPYRLPRVHERCI